MVHIPRPEANAYPAPGYGAKNSRIRRMHIILRRAKVVVGFSLIIAGCNNLDRGHRRAQRRTNTQNKKKNHVGSQGWVIYTQIPTLTYFYKNSIRRKHGDHLLYATTNTPSTNCHHLYYAKNMYENDPPPLRASRIKLLHDTDCYNNSPHFTPSSKSKLLHILTACGPQYCLGCLPHVPPATNIYLVHQSVSSAPCTYSRRGASVMLMPVCAS